MRISMLDMGERKYGDATYCEVGGKTILVDGAHKGDAEATEGEFVSIPDQLKHLTGSSPPFHIDLLVVTHCHSDHIGCLPEMVRDKILDVKWALLADPRMGFGVPLDQPFPTVAKGPTERVAAAAREEPLPPSASDAEIRELIDGASILQQRYHDMLVALAANGTKLVRYGRDSHRLLEREFETVGFKILGPTIDQLLICAYRIERERMRGAGTAEIERPDGLDEVALYRALVGGLHTDSEPEEEDGGIGAAVNNQSIVLKVGNTPDAVLLTGDMQFASPGIGGLRQKMPELRRVVQNAGPYGFIRLAHHGAANGTDSTLLDLLSETKHFGISTGANDPGHPSSKVISLLESRQPPVEWARTDRNGLVSLELHSERKRWSIERGAISDSSLCERRGPVPLPAPLPTTSQVWVMSATPEPEGRDSAARLTQAPRLTFVTDRERLLSRIGEAGDQALALAAAAGHRLLDVRSDRFSASDIARTARGSSGIVLLGGHSVIPSLLIDALPRALRRKYRNGSDDRDDFVVWSDDAYGDPDGVGLATIPVSRIPDAGDGALLLRALNPTSPSSSRERFGLRNCNRPFADEIFKLVPGTAEMLLSQPATQSEFPGMGLDVDNIYLMLHGYDDDGTRFAGEEAATGLASPPHVTALTLKGIPESCGATIFAGCCYGALWMHGFEQDGNLAELNQRESLALSFLRAGARAFVGATATHYSPVPGLLRSASGPFHEAFWRNVSAGKSPALSLMEAKLDYALGMPYGGASEIEYKTWRLFTCLGLGW